MCFGHLHPDDITISVVCSSGLILEVFLLVWQMSSRDGGVLCLMLST